ncbi:ATP synthase subunit a [Posidoniimonas polymericola]|uniref:ATP synthase subunit a n=1 Tax=Posidoniimonas polymericola TaxID=2528002 RepID=A0A5C5YM20_9BACT|nr:F0F1 ATP synthase subunit A [Posidoniimonas polymericola]TWT75964.1 ATP synthase subunit a [Posidoniimonas polymericola]
MSSAILHIKDSYYFEVPKVFAPSKKQHLSEFDNYWIRLDPDYQDWEAKRQVDALEGSSIELPESPEALLAEYHQWRSADANFAKPFDVFLEEAPSQKWFQTIIEENSAAKTEWQGIKAAAEDVRGSEDSYTATHEWSPEKIADYNHQLSGKLVIPQPFGELRNHYAMDSGIGISKYMILLTVGAIVIFYLCRKAGEMLLSGQKSRVTSIIEVFLEFIRDQIAKPTIGEKDAHRFVPFLWTLFLFILIMNLLGIIPFLGAPTASFAVTTSLALMVIAVSIGSGIKRFGVFGFLKNQVPGMDLHWTMALLIVPMIWIIEVAGFFIKHAVLSVRLLANMVAGHLVLLALMGIAVSAAGAASWWIAAPLSIFGAVAIDCLELFVAFLQAYVFTFLSGLFIGAAIHHH